MHTHESSLSQQREVIGQLLTNGHHNLPLEHIDKINQIVQTNLKALSEIYAQTDAIAQVKQDDLRAFALAQMRSTASQALSIVEFFIAEASPLQEKVNQVAASHLFRKNQSPAQNAQPPHPNLAKIASIAHTLAEKLDILFESQNNTNQIQKNLFFILDKLEDASCKLPPSLIDKVKPFAEARVSLILSTLESISDFNLVDQCTSAATGKDQKKEEAIKILLLLTCEFVDAIKQYEKEALHIQRNYDKTFSELENTSMPIDYKQQSVVMQCQKETIDRISNNVRTRIEKIAELVPKIARKTNLPLDELGRATLERISLTDPLFSTHNLQAKSHKTAGEIHMQKRLTLFALSLQQIETHKVALKKGKWKIDSDFKARFTNQAASRSQQLIEAERAHISIVPHIPLISLSTPNQEAVLFNPTVDLSEIDIKSEAHARAQQATNFKLLLNATDQLPWFVNAVDLFSELNDRTVAKDLMQKIINNTMSLEEANLAFCQKVLNTLNQLAQELKGIHAGQGKSGTKIQKLALEHPSLAKLIKLAESKSNVFYIPLLEAIAGMCQALKNFKG